MSGKADYCVLLPTELATEQLAARLARLLEPGDLLLLTGPLGAGKTFFAGAYCRALGLDIDEPVTSPTFTLVHEYPTQPPVAHADLYRLKREAEVLDLGLDSRRQEGWVLLVEWGHDYEAVLGGNAVELELEPYPEPRRATLRPRNPKSAWLIERLSSEAEG